MQFFKNRITIEKKSEIEEYISRYDHGTSGLTFTSLYLWRKENDFSYEIIHDFFCVAGKSNFEGFKEEPFVFPLIPLSGTFSRSAMEQAMEKIIGRFREVDRPFVIRLIPEAMIPFYRDLMPEKFLFVRDRANDDYIYRIEDLVSLKGRKFHGKKNHVNRFDREMAGRYEIVPMSSDLAEEALSLLKYVNGKKDVHGFEADTLSMEEDVLRDILPQFEALGMEGTALLIDGNLEAYAFGGPQGKRTIVEHIEKANTDYPGIYQKINQEFCRSMMGKYEYVNREEDMGLEGLRKAKSSYKPYRMAEKYIAMLAGDTEAIDLYSSLE